MDAFLSSHPLLESYGYAALFLVVFVEGFGIPAPGQTLVMAASALAVHGGMSFPAVLAVAWIAAVCGDNIGFALGHFGGRALLERLDRRLPGLRVEWERAEHFFDRYGGAVVLFARFFEGLRQINGIVAAASGMRWWRFVVYNALGAALWVGLWGGGVYLFGDVTGLTKYLRWVGLIALALLAATVLWWVRRLRT